MLVNIFYTVIEISFSTVVAAGILFLFSPLMNKRYTATWRLRIWLVLAFRLLIPVNVHFPWPLFEIPLSAASIPFFNEVPATAITSSKAEPALQTGLQQFTPSHMVPDIQGQMNFSLSDTIAMIWFIGIFCFLAYQISAYFFFKNQMLRWSETIQDTDILKAFSEALSELHIHKKIMIKKSRTVPGPMMIGFLNPILFLPDMRFQKKDYPLIFRHELIHYRHRDLWYKLFLTCANSVHWFNPFIYWMIKEANKEIEFSCDEEVVRNTSMEIRRQYSEIILSAIKGYRNTPFTTNFYGGKRAMKQRFQNIFNVNRMHRGTISFCVFIVAAFVAGSFVASASGLETKLTQDTFVISQNEKIDVYSCLKDSVYKDYQYYKDLDLPKDTLAECSGVEKYFNDYLLDGIVDGRKVISFSKDVRSAMLIVNGKTDEKIKEGIYCMRTEEQAGEAQYAFFKVDFRYLDKPEISRIGAITPGQSKYFQSLLESCKYRKQTMQTIAENLSIDLSKYQRITSVYSPKYGKYHLQALENHVNIKTIDFGPFRKDAGDTQLEFFLNQQESGGIILKQSQSGTCYAYTYEIIEGSGYEDEPMVKVTGSRTSPGKYISFEDYSSESRTK